MIERDKIAKLAKNIQAHAYKRGYVSAFTLAAYPVPSDEEVTLRITRECDGLVYGNAEVGSREALEALIDELDGKADYIFVDSELKKNNIAPRNLKSTDSILLSYNDMEVWVMSVLYTLLICEPELNQKGVAIVDEAEFDPFSFSTSLSSKFYNYSKYVGTKSVLQDDFEAALQRSEIIIGGEIYTGVITKDILAVARGNPVVVDAGIGTITPEASEYARKNGLKMIRVDNRAAMAGTLFSLIQSHDLVTRVMGEGEINGVKIVAGGIVGEPGAVIVDSIDNPTMVIGVADGTGKVIYNPENAEYKVNITKVTEALEKGLANG
ncbi:MAG TPA: hypothetical protein VGB30_00310 [bacterium]|jgi:hypothetical protein